MSHLEKTKPGRQVVHRDGGYLGGNANFFGVSTKTGQCHHSIPRLDTFDCIASGNNLTDNLETGNIKEFRISAIRIQALQDIGKVNSRGYDPQLDLILLGLKRRDLSLLQHLRMTVSLDKDRFHKNEVKRRQGNDSKYF